MKKESEKWCPKGKHFVSRDGFQKNGNRGDGLQTYCKECRSEYDAGRAEYNRLRYREWKENNPEKARLSARQSWEKHRDKYLSRKREYRQRNLQKIAAQLKAHYEANKQKYSERSRKYRRENAEAIKANARKYYLQNKEKMKAKSHRYYRENHSRMMETQRAYYRNNTERAKTHSRNRKAKIKAAQGKFTLQQWLAKLQYFGYRCYLCGVSLQGKITHADHRIPLSRGGSNWIANIAPACARCNLQKNNKTEEEYRNYLAGLEK